MHVVKYTKSPEGGESTRAHGKYYKALGEAFGEKR